jgi:hypothetical protein
MLKNGEWEIIIANDASDDCELVAEINKGDKMLAFITGKGGKRKITWYETDEDIDIPFDWFFEAMQIAKDRIK